MISILLNALISILVITVFWKISAHTFFIGTAIGFLLAIHPYCTFNAVLLFPIFFFLTLKNINPIQEAFFQDYHNRILLIQSYQTLTFLVLFQTSQDL